jgi:hypothetical protein
VQREQSGHTSRLHSKIARVIELTKLLRRLPTLLILALSAFYPGAPWTHLEAQNVEGQIVASQFGEFQVPGIDTGSLQFEPTACQVSGGGKNFAAFTVGVPIKIVDSNPNLTEVQTPAAVFINQCAVSMGTTYIHSTPFYLTSGTGGLQEALTNGPVKAGGPNTVILNADWYALVAPSNPATVIASVNGSTALGLVDVTTTPYTAYQWNGTAYAEVSYGGNLPSGSGIVKVTSGTGGVATPGADFLSPSITNGMLPQGTAITGTNYSSNQLQFIGSYCAGTSPCAPGYDEWNFQSYMGTGANPSSILNINHTGTSGPTAVDFDSQVLLGAGGTSTTVATGDNSTKIATTASVYNNMPGLSAAYFGAYGDAQAAYSGCSVAASSTTISCGSLTSFNSATDVGKQMWVPGGGASGVALHTTIASVTNATTAVLTNAAVTTSSNVVAVYGHDDSAALQACFNYSAVNKIACVLNSPTGYLVGSAGLQIAVNPVTYNGASNIQGASQTKGTNLFCEYNGDCLSLAAGPIQGANLANIAIEEDPTQPSSRGIHLNATVAAGPGSGGLFNSTLTNIEVDNPALECLWMDGGGGVGYAYNLPNQIDTFNNFTCNGPSTTHTANLIKMTGQAAQILFLNGQTNGYGTQATNPNWLIAIEEKTTGLGDTPTDVKFYGYTFEVGTRGLYVGEGASNIHFDNGYVEDIQSPFYAVTASGLTFNGNHIANSGNTNAVFQFAGQVAASVRDNFEYGSLYVPAAFAICENPNTIDFAQNISANATTSQCATNQITSSTSTLTVSGGQTEIVNGTTTPISTISAPAIAPGKTLTLNAWSSPGFTLTSGGNISFGGYSSPLVVPAGSSVTLTLFDLGPTWLITATNAQIAPAVFNQQAANSTGGTCAMSAGTTCTITLGHTYSTPVCIATQQSTTLTGGAVGCTVSGNTVTIKAATANSETWGALVFGNPN